MVSTLTCEEYNLAPIFGKLYTDPLPLDSMVEITRKYKKLYNSILEAREKVISHTKTWNISGMIFSANRGNMRVPKLKKQN